MLVDFVRVFGIFLPASVIIGITCVVVVVYAKCYIADKFKAARQGVVPSSIAMIGASYIILLVDEITVVFGRKHTGWNYHLAVLVPAMIMGLISAITIFRYENKQYRLSKTACKPN